ncbi:MAG: hypothetical protein ACM35G_08775 [Planctomycetaceae bacterium]
MLLPVGGVDLRAMRGSGTRVMPIDLSKFSGARPDHSLDLLFIHHSTGGHWLADPGPEEGVDPGMERPPRPACIYKTHPNGGGLRKALEEQGYTVNEASYRSRIGQDTDIIHWPPKFRDQMEQILTCQRQDTSLPSGRRNRIVMFKSCYPNNWFVGPGTPPGRADGPEKTVANAKAAYSVLLGYFEQHPDVLFVCVTAPPLAPRIEPEPLWKAAARRILGKPSPSLGEHSLHSGRLAREFNNWLKARNGWLKDYPHPNVVVFDYYDILTREGESDWSKYPTGDGFDSHPSSEGQRIATAKFIPFLNRAVRRAGLVELLTQTTDRPPA